MKHRLRNRIITLLTASSLIGGVRRLLSGVAFVGAVLGLVTLGAGPASAYPEWQTYSANSRWQCGPSNHLDISNYVIVQTCLITTSDMSKAQLVLVVSNRSTKTVELNGAEFDSELVGGAIDGHTELDLGFCGFYSLAAGQARGCFGKTVTYACGLNIGHVGYLWANNVRDNTILFATNHYC